MEEAAAYAAQGLLVDRRREAVQAHVRANGGQFCCAQRTVPSRAMAVTNVSLAPLLMSWCVPKLAVSL